MKYASLIAAAGFALLVPTISFADSAPGSEPPPSLEPSAATPSAPLICKYYYFNGRTLTRRDCRTAHEWERVRYSTQQDVMDLQHGGLLQKN